MQLIVVDDADTEIDVKEVSSFDFTNEIYRVSAALLRNDRGEVLLAQRSFGKRHAPGIWGPSAAGMLEAGETYGSNVVKEIREEIGLSFSIDELTRGPKKLTLWEHPKRQYFIQWYYGICNKPAEEFVLEAHEVAAVRWVAPDTLAREVREQPAHFIDIDLDILNH